MGEPLFGISLAEWSLHRALRDGTMAHLDFPGVARQAFGLDAVEHCSIFFQDKARDQAYLTDLKTRCMDHDVKSLLIMVDREGALGAVDKVEQRQAVDNHHRWVEAARFLGCHAIRVNARSEGTPTEQQQRVAAGLHALCEFADGYDIDVVVENHGGLSSNAAWLIETIARVKHRRCGTLPDFGNFDLGGGTMYDRYQGVAEMMPYARAVSAKSHAFNEAGQEIHTDYHRMMKIVLEAGYRGYVGIEYEGDKHSEEEGILLTKALLEKVREEA